MYKGKRILAVVPARGGSKGVPHKNIREFCGRPLIAWTLDAAAKSELIDLCVVSTDDVTIADVVRTQCADTKSVILKRPDELARDDSPAVDTFIHAMGVYPDYDYIVVLQATSPLRIVGDIDGCIRRCIDTGSASCVSVTVPEVSPYWMYTLEEENKLSPILELPQELSYQRQKLPPTYALNGAVYVCTYDFVRDNRRLVADGTTGYVMPPERSGDIDTMMDFSYLELLMKNMENATS